MRGKKGKSKVSTIKYLPVLLILLSITIMVGSTFAYFTDRKDTSSDLTFSKVELSADTTLGVDGVLRDVIPGSRIVDGAVAFSKAIDSEAIYVRAKISFTLPEEYADDEDMLKLLEGFRKSSDFNIVSGIQYGAVWSAKDGNYYYLLDSGDNANLKRVDTIDTYTLSREIIVPRDLEALEDNAQYMKSINFNIAFEAIQADNVSAILDGTKETFDLIFPLSQEEERFAPSFKVTFMGADLESTHNVVKVNDGQLVTEPTLAPEGEGERAIFDGWYLDKELTTEFDFTTPIIENIALYPKYIIGDTLTIMNADGQSVMTRIVVPDGEVTVEPSGDNYIDENGTSTHIVDGYYLDAEFTTKFEFGTTINQSYTVYPKVLTVSQGLEFSELTEAVTTSSSPDFRVSSEGVTSYSVADGTCADAYVVVPEYYLGKPVTQIKSGGFKGNTTITDIYMPNTIHTINYQAFADCGNIKKIVIPENVTNIGDYAYRCCNKLEEIVYNAKNITVYLDSNNYIFEFAGSSSGAITLTIGENVEKLPSYLFMPVFSEVRATPKITTIYYNAKSVEDLNNWNQVFGYLGQNTDGVDVYIGNKVERIPNYLFCPRNETTYTPKINSVTFEDDSSCLSIGQYSFSYLSALKTLEIPASVTSIEDYAFSSNKGIEEIAFEEGSQLETLGTYAFSGCNALASIVLPNGLTTINTGAFNYCTSLMALEIPASVTTITSNPFTRCPDLSLTVNSGNTTFKMEQNCLVKDDTILVSGFKTSTISNNILTIANSAFSGIDTMTTITIPQNVKTIENYAFSGCSGLTEVNYNAVRLNDLVYQNNVFQSVGSNAESFTFKIGTSAEYIPSYLISSIATSFVVSFDEGSNCTTLANHAFASSSGLTSIVLPNSVTTIGNYALSSCSKLQSITIPENVTSLGLRAFGSCSSLTSVYYNAINLEVSSTSNAYFFNSSGVSSGMTLYIGKKVTKIPNYFMFGYYSYSLREVPKLSNIVFDEESVCTTIGKNSFGYCDKLQRVTLSESVTTILDNAFAYCPVLEVFEMSNGVEEIGGYVFSNSENLKLIILSDNLTTMGQLPFNGTSAYILCGKQSVVNLYKSTRTYLLDTTGYESVTFTDSEVSGLSTGSDGTKTWLRVGQEGVYTYYKQYIERTVTFMDVDLTTTYQTITVVDGDKVSEPVAPTHSDENATFDGWYTEDTFENKFDFTTAINSNITLYPKYNLGYTLTVMDLDNQTQISSTLMQKGDIVEEIEITNPVDENGTTTKIVEGWYSDSAFTTRFEFGNELTENTTLYPKVLTVSSGLSFTELYENASDSTEITSYSVAKGTCADTEMVIPHMYLNKPVTQITARGFRLNTLKNIYIPNTVVIIGVAAFSEATALQSVVIPDSVTTINSEAFYNCAALTSITIGENVKTIGSLAFRYCKKLTKVYYNATNMNDVSSSTNIFNGSGATTGVELIIGNNVTRIPNNVFQTTLGFAISDIIFEEGSICTSIGDYAFGNIENLVNLTFPSSMETIGSYAFASCDKLETVIIPDNVTSIGEWAFQQNPSLKTVVLSDNLTILNSGLFSSCNALENVEMPKNLLEISYATFMNCSSLKTITIPESVVTIGGSAFRGCSGLTEINFNAVAVTGSSSMLTNIGFTGRGVTLNIGAKVSQVPASLFSGSGIKNVNFEEGSVCTLIGKNAFSGSTTLLSVNLPDSLTTIDVNAFSSCYALTSIIVPKNVTAIGTGAFSACYKLVEVINLSSLAISKGANTHGNIASYALNVVNSKELSKIVEINNCIFYNGGENNTYLLGCNSNETNLVLPNNCNGVNYDIYKYAFYKDNVLIDITIPGSVNSIGAEAFKSANYLERVVILEGVTTIQQKAFQECFNLKSIIIPSTSTNINSDYTFASLSGYILVLNETIASLVVTAKGNYVYVLDTTTDFSGITFTDTVDTGDVNGTYNDGTNYYVRTGSTGSYVYYKKYTA